MGRSDDETGSQRVGRGGTSLLSHSLLLERNNGSTRATSISPEDGPPSDLTRCHQVPTSPAAPHWGTKLLIQEEQPHENQSSVTRSGSQQGFL